MSDDDDPKASDAGRRSLDDNRGTPDDGRPPSEENRGPPDDGRPPPGEDGRPARPDLPAYVLDPLARQSPADLETVASYAVALAAWKREREPANEMGTGDDSGAAADGDRREREPVSRERLRSLESRGISTSPADYDEVPESGAYVTVKETKPGYEYYYWQWREGDRWRNRYVAPVEPSADD